jgi:hypothetical protein
VYDPIRTHPRFQQLLANMGLQAQSTLAGNRP